MPSIEYDLRYLRAALADLEGYLLSKELYWPISAKPPHGDPPYPRFTLGGILIARQSLSGRLLDSTGQEEYQEITRRFDETRAKWRTAWGQKAARSFSARLNQWNSFIDDYRKQPENNFDRFAYEVRKRVMMQLLQPEVDELSAAEAEMAKGLDRVLKTYFLEGKFIWDQDLMPSFPVTQFWYLYGSLSKSLPLR
jgi:hypothetical protein